MAPSATSRVHTLLPPLAIALAVVSAGTLLLTAEAIAPSPFPVDIASPPAETTLTDSLPGAAHLAELAETSGLRLPSTPAVVDMARLIYAPGAAGRPVTLPGPLLLVVEDGFLAVRMDGAGAVLQPGQAALVSAGSTTLRPGDGLALPTATGATFHNAGSEPVVALAAGVFPAPTLLSGRGRIGPTSWAEAWSPGATIQPLVGGWLIDELAGPATIALRRLNLQPGGAVALTATGPVDVAVETGVLTLEARGGLVWRQPPDGPDQFIAPASSTILLPDDGALLQDAAHVTLHNAGSGPLLVLVLTVTPAAKGGTLSTSAANGVDRAIPISIYQPEARPDQPSDEQHSRLMNLGESSEPHDFDRLATPHR